MCRHTAVREAGVSRHHGGSCQTFSISWHFGIEGCNGALNWTPITDVEKCKILLESHVLFCSLTQLKTNFEYVVIQ